MTMNQPTAGTYRWNESDLRTLKAYITTAGPRARENPADSKTLNVPPAHERRSADPTGCGDAFAGTIHGIMRATTG